MHANSWNLKSRKQRLMIMERTEAHRKHLINIMRAKSKVDAKNLQCIRHHASLPGNLFRRKDIEKDNEGMINRIIEINNSRVKAPIRPKTQLSDVGRNLKTFSNLNRTIRLKEIESQNTKMFTRLISTSPTIRREQWAKRDLQTTKYKQNLNRSKYLKPDYSQQACRLLAHSPKFHCLQVNTSFTSKKGRQSKVRF